MFADKYPKPWAFEQTDRRGGGVLRDANGQLLIRLTGDIDWDDDAERAADPVTHRPVFDDDDDGGELLDHILDCLNGTEPGHE
jgi:hypothetical protein